MTPHRVVRFEVNSAEVLERMAASPLPLGLEAPPAELQFFRVIQFDTPDRDLEQRNAVIRLRITEQHQHLTVHVHDTSSPDGSVVRRHSDLYR